MELAGRRVLVTGGTGFIGSALVRAFLRSGARVRSLDSDFRGTRARLGDLGDAVELIHADVRDPQAVAAAVRGVDGVIHLAAVNGTAYFYSQPELVLEVAVKGMLNVLDACLKHGVRHLVLASSSEVYQTAPTVPTPEAVPLVVPDVFNPRYSYAGGKIISELLAINYGRRHFDRVVVFRPHNVYGPDMGWEHVIPQFAVRMRDLASRVRGTIPFPIEGSGSETRAFVHIADAVDSILRVIARGEHLGVYHVGNDEEVTVADLARMVARCLGREIEILPGALRPGSAPRRCPDISRLRALGYRPGVPLAEGLPPTVHWCVEHAPVPEGGRA